MRFFSCFSFRGLLLICFALWIVETIDKCAQFLLLIFLICVIMCVFWAMDGLLYEMKNCVLHCSWIMSMIFVVCLVFCCCFCFLLILLWTY